ncbi:MAG: glycosyltransferase family 4 protein [Promethearchaeota archaeon]
MQKIGLKVGINLTFLKKNITGVKVFTENLLKAIFSVSEGKEIEYYIFLTNDLFSNYKCIKNKSKNIFLKSTLVKSDFVLKRILWENFKFNNQLKKLGINIVYSPFYSMPLRKDKQVKYIITIHDLLWKHYPEEYSLLQRLWLKFSIKRIMENADIIIAISNFVKNDIMNNFKINSSKIVVLKNPIPVERENVLDFKLISEKYGIEQSKYFYTIVSHYKHKNLVVLFKLMKNIKYNNINIPQKLVISGINEKYKEKFICLSETFSIKDNLIFTDFISNSEKNALIKNCFMFLFPSVFEGFGMPLIEAMSLGTKVVTTKYTSIPEVTQDKAFYVDDPFNELEWLKSINKAKISNFSNINYQLYSPEIIAKNYIKLFQKIKKIY